MLEEKIVKGTARETRRHIRTEKTRTRERER